MSLEKFIHLILGIAVFCISTGFFSFWIYSEDLFINLFASMVGLTAFMVCLSIIIPIFTLSDEQFKEFHSNQKNTRSASTEVKAEGSSRCEDSGGGAS